MTNLLKTLRPLLNDFLSTIVFIAVYSVTGHTAWGVVAGIAVGIGQIGILLARGVKPDLMQWASLALVVVLGSAALLTSDPRFVMIKPSIGEFAIAGVMLRKGWLLRYMPARATLNLPPSVPIAWGYVWSAMIFALGLANLYVAFALGLKAWTWFTAFMPISSQLALFAVQYVSMRMMVIRNIRAHGEQVAPAE
jgi:intracellular septation protein